MGSGKKRALHIGIAFIFVAFLVANGFALASAILLPSIWTYLIVLGIISFDLYFLYIRFYQKKKPRYPMVSPEGEADIYFPRTNIPRPIHEDARKMQEKKRKLDRIEKMRYKKKKR